MVVVSFADATIARLPRPVRTVRRATSRIDQIRDRRATTFVIDSAIFYTLKLTVLEPKPVTAKIIAGIVAVIASHLEPGMEFPGPWWPRTPPRSPALLRVQRRRVLLSMAPCGSPATSCSCALPNVSLTMENLADFVSAYIIGNLLQMAFRFWVFRRWVFPDEVGRDPGAHSSRSPSADSPVFEDEVRSPA